MTDQEIVQGLIAKDNLVTEEFFFVKYRPLFYGVMKLVFDYEVEYDEMVNELYVYLMEDDAGNQSYCHRRWRLLQRTYTILNDVLSLS